MTGVDLICALKKNLLIFSAGLLGCGMSWVPKGC